MAAGKTKENDHRNSKSYQMLTRYIMASYNIYAVKNPHPLFFGLDNCHLIRVVQFGTLTVTQFLNLKRSATYNPSVAEAFLVQTILIARGSPVEIAVRILRFMDYETKRRIPIPNDPFHPSNKEELMKYLEYC